MDLKKYIRSIPDYPKKGILFRDITTLIKDNAAFKESIDQMAKMVEKVTFDKIGAIESRGFIFASALSYKLSKSLILMRKKDKLPAEKYSVNFELEYGESTLEMHKDSIKKDEKVIIVDDLIATGGTANTVGELVVQLKGDIVCFAFLINLVELNGIDMLKPHKVFCVIEY